MASMYETIMELPLFKGIGEEQLSQMLEKTSIEFLRFEDGDVIANEFARVNSVDFILSGRIRNTFRLENFPIEIDEILGVGAMVGALHLFGLDTTYGSSAIALGKVSIMRVEKSQYMKILQSDGIYILNFVNYLSAAAQKGSRIQLQLGAFSIGRQIKTLTESVVSRAAESVVIAASDHALADFCGVSVPEFRDWKSAELAHNRIIVNQRGILIKSPRLLR